MKKWYEKDWGIKLLCLLVFPVGVYLVWKKSGWSQRSKLLATGLGLGLFLSLASLLSDPSSTGSSSYSSELSLSEATSVAQEQCRSRGCEWCDVNVSVENTGGNYGIVLYCGPPYEYFITYEISKQGKLLDLMIDY